MNCLLIFLSTWELIDCKNIIPVYLKNLEKGQPQNRKNGNLTRFLSSLMSRLPFIDFLPLLFCSALNCSNKIVLTYRILFFHLFNYCRLINQLCFRYLSKLVDQLCFDETSTNQWFLLQKEKAGQKQLFLRFPKWHFKRSTNAPKSFRIRISC